MRSIFLYLFTLLTSVTPLVVLGASVQAPKDFKGLVGLITGIIETLILLVFVLTFLAFMWGIIKGWIIGGGDTESVDKGKKVVLVGIIVLVIMSSIWGILQLLQSSLFGG